MKKSFFKRVSVLLSLALMITLVAPVPAMAASGGKLVKSVKRYDYYKLEKYNPSTSNYDVLKAKYEITYKDTFKYSKAYPTSIESLVYNGGVGYTSTLKYKMKKNKPKSMKLKNSLKKVSTKNKYNKKGFLTKSTYTDYFKRDKTTETYKYNKNGFVTAYAYNNTDKNMWGTEINVWKRNYTYSYKMKKGLPKDLVITAVTSHSYTDTQDPSDSYNGTPSTSTYFATFNGKGLITSVGYVYGGTRYVNYTVKYKTKKGKVVSAVVYDVEETNDNGTVKKQTPARKYTFSYAKDKAAKGRYANMINSMLEFSSYYGTYTWF